MIKIIDNQKDLCLKLGDIVTHNNDKDIYIVIETWKYCSDEIVYALKNIYQDAPCVEIADESLENLTKRAITLGYKIYNQDDYDMIIRRKIIRNDIMDLIDKILEAESRKLTIEYIVDNNYFNPNLDIYIEIKNKDEQDYLVNMIEVSHYEIIRFLDISHFKDTRETLKEYPKYIYLESLKNRKIMFNIYTSKAMESVKGLFNVIDIYDIDYEN